MIVEGYLQFREISCITKFARIISQLMLNFGLIGRVSFGPLGILKYIINIYMYIFYI